LFKTIQMLQKRGKRAILITRFGKDLFFKSLLDAYGGYWGDPICETDLEKYNPYFTDKRPSVVDGEVIVEPLRIVSNLYIFGAGHISQYLAKAAKMVDFNITVIDDRADFANKERFPEADKIVAADFAGVFDELDYTGDVYVVIVTRGHKYDAYVLEEALKRPAKYIGMIGSKRKVKMVFDYLKGKGLQEEALKNVFAPIGLDINSETPQEIAISITAEIIKARGE
jgi:xanthine dehydrogenase accessory factor